MLSGASARKDKIRQNYPIEFVSGAVYFSPCSPLPEEHWLGANYILRRRGVVRAR